MIAEFKSFLLKTNALALAVGVIIGAALGGVVNSLVNDIIMPPIGVLLGGVDFSALSVVLRRPRATPPEVAIRYGRVPQHGHRVHRDRLRRLADLQDVHQGRAGRGAGAGEDLPVLQAVERGRRVEVHALRQRDLTRPATARPDGPPATAGRFDPGRSAADALGRPRVGPEDPDHRRCRAEIVDRRRAGRLGRVGVQVHPEDVLPGRASGSAATRATRG